MSGIQLTFLNCVPTDAVHCLIDFLCKDGKPSKKWKQLLPKTKSPIIATLQAWHCQYWQTLEKCKWAKEVISLDVVGAWLTFQKANKTFGKRSLKYWQIAISPSMVANCHGRKQAVENSFSDAGSFLRLLPKVGKKMWDVVSPDERWIHQSSM